MMMMMTFITRGGEGREDKKKDKSYEKRRQRPGREGYSRAAPTVTNSAIRQSVRLMSVLSHVYCLEYIQTADERRVWSHAPPLHTRLWFGVTVVGLSSGDQKCSELGHGFVILERKEAHNFDTALDFRTRGSPYQQRHEGNHALAYANHLELAQLQAGHGLRLSSKAWLAPEGEARQASGVLFEDGIENLSACNVVG